MSFDVEKIRKDFPILGEHVHGKPLVYLDNAATTQKPRIVIDKISDYYLKYNSNVHRGVHKLSQVATSEHDKARRTVQKFLNAKHDCEVIFTRGTTEAINLVAYSFGKAFIKPGDEIIVSGMEHHSNIVPWQIVCQDRGAVLRVIPLNDDGELIYEEYLKLLNDKTKLVAVVHVSNSLGTVNPVKQIIKDAHKVGAKVLIDGAQSVQHLKVDVQDLDCDFYAISGHKIYGPTGIGALYGKKDLLEQMPPYQGGGDMIRSVSFEKTTYNDLPYKFEAGTPNIADTIAFGTAIEYISGIGLDVIAQYEAELLEFAMATLSELPELRHIGTAKHKASVVAFDIKGVHPHDIGTMLDMDGVAIRTGQHCTEPVMRRFNLPATSRASLSFYNTKAEILVLKESLIKVIKMFS